MLIQPAANIWFNDTTTMYDYVLHGYSTGIGAVLLRVQYHTCTNNSIHVALVRSKYHAGEGLSLIPIAPLPRGFTCVTEKATF